MNNKRVHCEKMLSNEVTGPFRDPPSVAYCDRWAHSYDNETVVCRVQIIPVQEDDLPPTRREVRSVDRQKRSPVSDLLTNGLWTLGTE